MTSWYLLYCKRGQLARAQEHLTRQEVGCFAPMMAVEKHVRGKQTSALEPVFPNYLFVQFDPEIIHTTTISATRGVNHFVRFGSTLATVPEKVIKALQEAPYDLPKAEDPLQVGEAVTITAGIFKGMSAIYHEADGEKRSILLLNLLNTTVPRSIKNNEFLKV